jgi:hypothetical protein
MLFRVDNNTGDLRLRQLLRIATVFDPDGAQNRAQFADFSQQIAPYRPDAGAVSIFEAEGREFESLRAAQISYRNHLFCKSSLATAWLPTRLKLIIVRIHIVEASLAQRERFSKISRPHSLWTKRFEQAENHRSYSPVTNPRCL